MTYFKLNNHANHAQGCVAYYCVPAPLVGGGNGYARVQPGQRLDLVVNNNALNSLQHVPVGERIVIFQNIQGVSQVVTHLLRVTGQNTYQHGLGGEFQGWPHARTTVVERMLNPAVFGAAPGPHQAPNGPLIAQHAPHNPRRLQHLLDGYRLIQQGRVYHTFGGISILPDAVDKQLVPANGYLLHPQAW